MDRGNLLQHIPAALPQELLQPLAAADGVRIERIVSRGHSSPSGFWYDQPEREWVLLVQGQASLRFERDNLLLQLQPGDYVRIDAHERHRVEATGSDCDTVWLAVFY